MSKSNRLRVADIAANVQGVDANNFIKFCETLEGWVGIPLDEDHPLKLGVPSPQIRNDESANKEINEFVSSWFDKWRSEYLGNKELEIDWDSSGEQYLVHSQSGDIYVYHGMHKHDGDMFYGSRIGSGNWRWVSKHLFVRGTGLFLEPKNPGNPEPEIDWSKKQLLKDADGEVYMSHGFHDGDTVYVSPICGRIPGCNRMKKDFTFHSDVSHELEMDILFGRTRKPDKEIDWSRQQLVKSIYSDRIVKTTGAETAERFTGIETKTNEAQWWLKDRFAYHGEVSEEEMDEHAHNLWHGTTPAPSEEPKTTGLNFMEAMKAVFSGHRVQRSIWHKDVYYMAESFSDKVAIAPSRTSLGDPTILKCEVFATDWQIIKQ